MPYNLIIKKVLNNISNMGGKFFCRKCKGIRNHNFLFEHELSGGDQDYNFSWRESYKVIQCNGCDCVSFLKIYGDNSMIRPISNNDYEYYEEETIYPYYLENGTELSKYQLPAKISNIYEETISAFKAKAYILTAGGLRAIIEAVCNNLKIKKSTLEERIHALHTKGFLTINESKRLHSIRFSGNDALHEIETPKRENLEILLEIINHLLTNLFLNDNMLKGKIETIIDDFEEFFKFIKGGLKKEMIGETITINKILGKSIRRISKTNLKAFLEEINLRIDKGDIKFLDLIDSSKNEYKVIEKPEDVFLANW